VLTIAGTKAKLSHDLGKPHAARQKEARPFSLRVVTENGATKLIFQDSSQRINLKASGKGK
jgi:hypothetical protein